MKISLIDYDNTNYPNLALMKISAWNKKRGHEVKFYEPIFDKPDVIYCSKVFKFNKSVFPVFDNIKKGGTGFTLDITKNLPSDIEHICPDYSLYNADYSMGFVTRGCFRKCSFCIVQAKEGGIRFNAHISEFQRHKKVVLLDNNILASEKGIEELENISKTDTLIDMNQGLDFRLVDNYIAELLSRLKWINGVIRTACDSNSVFERVKKTVEMLGVKGVKPYRIFCYTLVTGKEDIPRILELDKLGIIPFAMGYMDFQTGEKSQVVKDICCWVNKRSVFAAQKDFSKIKFRKEAI